MGKIIDTGGISKIAAGFKTENKKIVLAGGCFDILHIGHITFLEKAKSEGDILILLLESDEAIKKLKGERRPINSQQNRAKVLSSIEYVDFVITLPKTFKTSEYENLVLKIKPDIIAITSGDPNLENKKSQAKLVDGEVRVVLNQIAEHSTTKLLDYF